MQSDREKRSNRENDETTNNAPPPGSPLLRGGETKTRGTAMVVAETSSSVSIDVDMQTAGLVVLSDRWVNGWRASLGGRELPILKTNYALRGVEVPAGKGRLEFVYEPRSFYSGLWLACGAAVVLVVLGAFAALKRRSLPVNSEMAPQELAVAHA